MTEYGHLPITMRRFMQRIPKGGKTPASASQFAFLIVLSFQRITARKNSKKRGKQSY